MPSLYFFLIPLYWIFSWRKRYDFIRFERQSVTPSPLHLDPGLEVHFITARRKNLMPNRSCPHYFESPSRRQRQAKEGRKEGNVSSFCGWGNQQFNKCWMIYDGMGHSQTTRELNRAAMWSPDKWELGIHYVLVSGCWLMTLSACWG